jgi:hypothetical protein
MLYGARGNCSTLEGVYTDGIGELLPEFELEGMGSTREVLKLCIDAQQEQTPSVWRPAVGPRSWDDEQCEWWLEDFDELEDALLSVTRGTVIAEEEPFHSS